MLLVVIANGVEAAVEGVVSKVRDIDLGGVPSNEGLQLSLVKHGEPRRGDDGA